VGGVMRGSEFALAIQGMDQVTRESAILAAVGEGWMPAWLLTQKWQPVKVAHKGRTLVYFVSPDYFSIGTDDDYVRMPMRPATFQTIADAFYAIMPTKHMVDAIWATAGCKIAPHPFPPGAAMVTVPRFVESNAAITKQLDDAGCSPTTQLIAGDKKDVVIGPNLDGTKVAIYGWHQENGKPIQSYPGPHTVDHVDYSHGARLVSRHALLDGELIDLVTIFQDPNLYPMVSDQGMFDPYFPNAGSGSKTPPPAPVPITPASYPMFEAGPKVVAQASPAGQSADGRGIILAAGVGTALAFGLSR